MLAVGRVGEGAWCPEMLDCGSWRMPPRSAHSLSRHMPGVLMRLPRVEAASNVRHMPGVLKWMPGMVICMPGVEAIVTTRQMPGDAITCLVARLIQPRGTCLGCLSTGLGS
jgi:hypothetical protein